MKSSGAGNTPRTDALSITRQDYKNVGEWAIAILNSHDQLERQNYSLKVALRELVDAEDGANVTIRVLAQARAALEAK